MTSGLEGVQNCSTARCSGVRLRALSLVRLTVCLFVVLNISAVSLIKTFPRILLLAYFILRRAARLCSLTLSRSRQVPHTYKRSNSFWVSSGVLSKYFLAKFFREIRRKVLGTAKRLRYYTTIISARNRCNKWHVPIKPDSVFFVNVSRSLC